MDFESMASDHMIVELQDEFHVRTIGGRVRSAVGDWPEEVVPAMEIRPVRRSDAASTTAAVVSPDGVFEIRNVPPGKYCFRTMALGWQTVIGTILVDPKAPHERRLLIEMPLGQ